MHKYYIDTQELIRFLSTTGTASPPAITQKEKP